MRSLALIASAGLLAYGAWRLSLEEGDGISLDSVQDLGDNIVSKTLNALQLWRAPAQYAATIAAAEGRHGLPPTLLERLLWQESRYRQDIISGATKSPAGALGIAQFMPATAKEFGIDPLNTDQAINAAGKYVRQLFNRFGNWTEALAAYNWGQGNVSRKGLANAPRETRNYYTQILADVNSTAGTAYA